MPGIFISYRREDSIGHTGRLYDLLAKHFGKEQVFMDIDTIGPGENFAEVIEKTCNSCDVLLAIIGRSWINVRDPDGNRRLDNPDDFVRQEIVHALKKPIRVVPILVDGARMPDAKVLPDDMKPFALRNAWELNDMRFHHDVDQLIQALLNMQPNLRPTHTPTDQTQQAEKKHVQIPRRTIYAGIAAIVVVAVVLIAVFGWFRSTPAPNITENTSSVLTGGRQTFDIPSLQANVTGLRFFEFSPSRTLPPPGERPYSSTFRSSQSSGKLVFWEIALNFQGRFPPPDYQIESIWYRNSQEVYRGVGSYQGSVVPSRAYHCRFSWDPPGGLLSVGQYRVDLFVAGQRITSGTFAVQP